MNPRDLAGAALFHLNRLALDRGLRSGRRDYRRFIILGRGRTGSNLLRGLLNAHSQVVTFGELFRFYDSIGWEFPDYDRFQHSRETIALMQHDPVAFLERLVFRAFPRPIAAVGFKLFYYHAQEDSRRGLWDYLRERRDIAVVHVKRANTLRMILSEKKAFRTNDWTNTTGAEGRKLSVAITHDECRERFEHEHRAAAEFDRFFERHPRLEVIYEQLSADYGNQMKSVQAFLGVDHEAHAPATYKQANQPLAEAISNYFELKQSFCGTPWERFFDE